MMCLFIIFFCLHFCTFTQQFNKSYTNNNTDDFVQSKYRTFIEGEEIVFRVVRGRPSRLGEVPYQIAVMKQLKERMPIYQAFCGGSIIKPAKVLTAAHCIYPDYVAEGKDDTKRLAVVAGQLWTTAWFDKQGQWRLLSKGKYHPTYKFPKDDIALLFLKNNFEYNLAVQPIPYATQFQDFVKNCKASGYGFINNKKQSQFLLVAFIKTMWNRTCYRIHRRDTTNFVCTSDSVANIHSGDSGGPLVCTDTGDPAEGKVGVQIGVVCAGHDTAPFRTIFTRVSEYYDFLATSKSNVTLVSAYILLLILLIDYLLY